MFGEDFEKIIKRLSPTLRRISHRLNGHFAYFNDDDLCQEALVHLWVLFQDGKLSDKTDSYILQGCYFHLKNYIRTSVDKINFTSMESPVDEEGTMLEEMIASSEPSSADQLEGRALREEVEKRSLNKREEEGNEKGEQILHLISQELREEVYFDFYGKVINSIKDCNLTLIRI